MILKKTSVRSELLKGGFALISTIILMSLLVVITMGTMSLSTLEQRSSSNFSYQMAAEANARIALIEAISKLQLTAGSDQRVTARAAILENPNSDEYIPNRNWLGVWKTTYSVGDRDWPLIGKAPDEEKTNEPYQYKGIYTDLRTREPRLKEDKWKESLRLAWLVSGADIDLERELSIDDPSVVEIIGKGTLGEEGNYMKDRVLIPKVEVHGSDGVGAFAWYVSDNNQKANLKFHLPDEQYQKQALAASTLDNPTAIEVDDERPFEDYMNDIRGKSSKIYSLQSSCLAANSETTRARLNKVIKAHVHDFTVNSEGLFTDPVYGGFKKDLTALLLANPDEVRVEFDPPNHGLGEQAFSSRFPVIPGPRKLAQGPSFAAMRDWCLLRNIDQNDSVNADTTVDTKATRVAEGEQWMYGVSDGKGVIASQWAEYGAKLRPVMTDCRYHFYYSYIEDDAIKRIRTHLIPRVCIWNPYNVKMNLAETTVLMPNPFGAENFSKRFHFIFSEAEENRLKEYFSDDQSHKVHSWQNQRIYLRGNEGGLFPKERFLGFQLEKTTLEPGQCLVFSPKVNKPIESAEGISIQLYDNENISQNVLSAREPQGENHFVYNYGSEYLKMDSGKSSEGINLPNDLWQEMRLNEIRSYEPWVQMEDNFNFIWKDGVANTKATEASKLLTSIQTMNHGNGGTQSYGFWFYKTYLGDSGSSFGYLSPFNETPRKDAPRYHQIGTKLLWIDESNTEGSAYDPAPLRVGVWSADSLAYHPISIANWNIRPHLITRSPASPVGQDRGNSTWYATSSGSWMQQLAPKSPQDFSDMPSLANNGYFSKPALSIATQDDISQRIVLFDLPDPEYGVLSLGAMRHATLSPFSWHPSYIVGNSLADLHAPFDSTSHPSVFEESYHDEFVNNSWDYTVGGGFRGIPYKHGARVRNIATSNFLQIAEYATSVDIDDQSIKHEDEHLVYDVSYEVNQNLWDHFFLSGMPLNSTQDRFDWNSENKRKLKQIRYEENGRLSYKMSKRDSLLAESLDNGFWLNGYFLQNKSAFNVNSTSVKAWTAFLSGLRGVNRYEVNAEDYSLISRVRKPERMATTVDQSQDLEEAWSSGRRLTDQEIVKLAEAIVVEVKSRGPFISMSDFVNRRLVDRSNSHSHRGAIEAAIDMSGVNNHLKQGRYMTPTASQVDNNHSLFQPDEKKRIDSKLWGIPGYLTQADILEPFAPAMTVRGDVFTIRCYGEARDESGNVRASAYLEAIVARGAEYMESTSIDKGEVSNGKNRATDPALRVDYLSGKLIPGNLSPINKKFGRRFYIKSVRWMNSNEI